MDGQDHLPLTPTIGGNGDREGENDAFPMTPNAHLPQSPSRRPSYYPARQRSPLFPSPPHRHHPQPHLRHPSTRQTASTTRQPGRVQRSNSLDELADLRQSPRLYSVPLTRGTLQSTRSSGGAATSGRGVGLTLVDDTSRLRNITWFASDLHSIAPALQGTDLNLDLDLHVHLRRKERGKSMRGVPPPMRRSVSGGSGGNSVGLGGAPATRVSRSRSAGRAEVHVHGGRDGDGCDGGSEGKPDESGHGIDIGDDCGGFEGGVGCRVDDEGRNEGTIVAQVIAPLGSMVGALMSVPSALLSTPSSLVAKAVSTFTHHTARIITSPVRCGVSFARRATEASAETVSALGNALMETVESRNEWFHQFRRRRRLAHAVNHATSHTEWLTAARRLDDVSGATSWRANPRSPMYDHRSVLSHVHRLSTLTHRTSSHEVAFVLRDALSRELHHVTSAGLYVRSMVGTKRVIEEFTRRTCDTMRAFCANGFRGPLSAADRRTFFLETAAALGRTALLLSGGSVFALKHLGVAKALHEQRLLPRIICGASGGSILAAAICCAPTSGAGRESYDARLSRLFAYIAAEGFAASPFERYNVSASSSSASSSSSSSASCSSPSPRKVSSSMRRPVSPPWSVESVAASARRKLRRLRRRGVFLSLSALKRFILRFVPKNETFREAFHRTGRILNITVSAAEGSDLGGRNVTKSVAQALSVLIGEGSSSSKNRAVVSGRPETANTSSIGSASARSDDVGGAKSGCNGGGRANEGVGGSGKNSRSADSRRLNREEHRRRSSTSSQGRKRAEFHLYGQDDEENGPYTDGEGETEAGRETRCRPDNYEPSYEEPTLLCNFLTTPNVLVYTAVLASCAVPMLFPPVQLLCKNFDGRIEPYCSHHTSGGGVQRATGPGERAAQQWRGRREQRVSFDCREGEAECEEARGEGKDEEREGMTRETSFAARGYVAPRGAASGSENATCSASSGGAATAGTASFAVQKAGCSGIRRVRSDDAPQDKGDSGGPYHDNDAQKPRKKNDGAVKDCGSHKDGDTDVGRAGDIVCGEDGGLDGDGGGGIQQRPASYRERHRRQRQGSGASKRGIATQKARQSSRLFADGTVSSDLPITRMTELFNVTQCIVSQVNPLISLLVSQDINAESEMMRRGELGWGVQGFVARARHLLSSELRHRVSQALDIGIVPSILRPWLRFVTQPFSGRLHVDVTIVPKSSLLDNFQLLSTVTPDSVKAWILSGEQATWPRLAGIKTRLRIEQCVVGCLEALEREEEANVAVTPLRSPSAPSASSTSGLIFQNSRGGDGRRGRSRGETMPPAHAMRRHSGGGILGGNRRLDGNGSGGRYCGPETTPVSLEEQVGHNRSAISSMHMIGSRRWTLARHRRRRRSAGNSIG